MSGSTERDISHPPEPHSARSTNPLKLDSQNVLDTLLGGEMVEVHGLMPWSSNYTFLVTVRQGDVRTLAVYKPSQGVQPLWDFPQASLALREVAAYLVSQELGWDFIPPTVLRDGKYGPGAVQLFIDADFNQHYFTMREDDSAVFQRVAVFDVITNNADRKAGHFLRDAEGRVWVVDHGLTFHAEPKLRTVVWDFAGQPIPAHILGDLVRLQSTLRDSNSRLTTHLSGLISQTEVQVLRQRNGQLVRAGRYPEPDAGRNIPFPLV